MKFLIALVLTFTTGLAGSFGLWPCDNCGPCKSTTCESSMQKQNIADYLQEVSVMVRVKGGTGSGTIFVRGDTTYILCCGHVTQSCKCKKHGRAIFEDASLVKKIVENGKIVGEVSWQCEILRHSPAGTSGEDLSILRVKSKRFKPKESAKAYLDEQIPPIGTELYHVGSLLGDLGHNSLTSGIISQHGREYQGSIFDQTTCTAFPGSSGGGVFLKSDGRLIGIIVLGCGETFNLMVPVRRIREWSRRVGMEFVFDESIHVPDEKTLRSIPIEEPCDSCDSCCTPEESNRRRSKPAGPRMADGRPAHFELGL